MVFPSVEYAIFFPVVLVVSWLLMPRHAWWKLFILVASYVFYAAADPRFCLLLAGITVGNQLAVAGICRSSSERVKTAVMAVAVAGNLAVLAVFKYFNFFIEQVNWVQQVGGLGLPLPVIAVVLPIGLSFITFQAISYTVDVRRGTCERARLLDVGIYLSFFPHLVAGPIVRANEFLPQLKEPRDPRRVAVGAGVVLIAGGLIKKVVVADTLARSIVDPVFAVPDAFGGPDVMTAMLAYAVQIYCDFSGYTDMAIGFALLMGFIFPQNFNRPYRAISFRDFWRRWHITLSRYLRDFVYIPLGGNRKGPWRTTINLMITMLLGGLWHGAAWGFILWGGIYGVALSVEHALRRQGVKSPPKVIGWAIVFTVVVVAWVPFRAPSLTDAWTVLSRIPTGGELTLLTPFTALLIATVLAVQWLPVRPLAAARLVLERSRPVALGVGLALVIIVVAASVPGGAVPPFIYFQF